MQLFFRGAPAMEGSLSLSLSGAPPKQLNPQNQILTDMHQNQIVTMRVAIAIGCEGYDGTLRREPALPFHMASVLQC